jgi:indolepyruvate ferredoxin oxidoreductase, beta subunit
MAYEDTIRVAELKIRRARFERVRREVQAGGDQIVEIREYMHPRLQEIAESIPAPLGRWLMKPGPARWIVERLTAKGRVINTTSIAGFLVLYGVASLKPLRPRSMRFEAEDAHLTAWLAEAVGHARTNYDLGVEVAECLNLVKGYGDTHARGRANYAAILGALPRVADRTDAAGIIRDLRQAALADDTGASLAAALERLATPAPEPPQAERAA